MFHTSFYALFLRYIKGMKNILTRRLFMGGALAVMAGALWPFPAAADLVNFNFLKKKGADFPYKLPDQQWRDRLGAEAYDVMRNGENETAGTSPLLRERRKGTYVCKGCATPLFASTSKIMTNDYPTFRAPIDPKRLGLSTDFGIILPRTEVHCKNCGSHLGYKFLVDGEGPSIWRYAINGLSLVFRPA